MEPVYTEKYKGLTIELHQDTDCENPLDNGNDGVFITYNKRSRSAYGNTPLDQDEHEDIGKRIESGELIGLPVYVYEHGGVMMSTRAFSCPWDSGQSGFIYVTKATALEWMGGKVLTKKRREKTIQNLECIVDAFGKWCNGESYGYIIKGKDGEDLGSMEDSCWGFIGDKYCMEQAKESADYIIEQIDKAKHEDWRAALREARERKHWAQRDVVTE